MVAPLSIQHRFSLLCSQLPTIGPHLSQVNQVISYICMIHLNIIHLYLGFLTEVLYGFLTSAISFQFVLLKSHESLLLFLHVTESVNVISPTECTS